VNRAPSIATIAGVIMNLNDPQVVRTVVISDPDTEDSHRIEFY